MNLFNAPRFSVFDLEFTGEFQHHFMYKKSRPKGGFFINQFDLAKRIASS